MSGNATSDQLPRRAEFCGGDTAVNSTSELPSKEREVPVACYIDAACPGSGVCVEQKLVPLLKPFMQVMYAHGLMLVMLVIKKPPDSSFYAGATLVAIAQPLKDREVPTELHTDAACPCRVCAERKLVPLMKPAIAAMHNDGFKLATLVLRKPKTEKDTCSVFVTAL